MTVGADDRARPPVTIGARRVGERKPQQRLDVQECQHDRCRIPTFEIVVKRPVLTGNVRRLVPGWGSGIDITRRRFPPCVPDSTEPSHLSAVAAKGGRFGLVAIRLQSDHSGTPSRCAQQHSTPPPGRSRCPRRLSPNGMMTSTCRSPHNSTSASHVRRRSRRCTAITTGRSIIFTRSHDRSDISTGRLSRARFVGLPIRRSSRCSRLLELQRTGTHHAPQRSNRHASASWRPHRCAPRRSATCSGMRSGSRHGSASAPRSGPSG